MSDVRQHVERGLLKFGYRLAEAVIHTRLRHSLNEIYRRACSWGEYNVILYKRYRNHGMPRLARKAGLSAWRHILRSLPTYWRMDFNRAQFIWSLAWRIGRLKGSLKHRAFAL
jgi:hypothetical protein